MKKFQINMTDKQWTKLQNDLLKFCQEQKKIISMTEFIKIKLNLSE